MNEESFIERNNWVKPAPDLPSSDQFLYANRQLGRTAISEFLRPTNTRTGSGVRQPVQFISPKITKKATELYSRLSVLRSVVKKSHEVLAAATTVIVPFNIFPDTIVVDRTKITITKRTFFWSKSVISVRIEDVLNVGMSTGPLFGSLTISSRVMNSTDHFNVNYFWRSDAIYLKHIIQGYVIAHHNSIDTKDLSREELIETLLEIGRDSD